MSFLVTMSIRRLATVLVLAAGAFWAVSAPAEAPARGAPLSGEAAQVKRLLEQKFQGAKVGSVTKSPYFGLYEVLFDEQLVYTDAKVSYVLVGNVYDAATKKNLTEAKKKIATANMTSIAQPTSGSRSRSRNLLATATV